MLELSKKSNLLEQSVYQYSLQDIDEPNLYREIYNYEEIPKIPFNHRRVPLRMPDEIWITDTTFRDGQQSRAPYTVKQITDLYKMLSQLGGPKGLIRQTEFFLYGEQDRKALYACREMGLAFPEITTWIRASMKDFQLVKDMEIEETGILVSCSDYHIFKKLNMKRSQAIDYYKKTVAAALDMGIRPRCHFEDITRADYYGFVLPFISELQKMSDEAGIPIKIRACDTMGYGTPFSEVALPRSVPGIVYGLHHYANVPSEMIEWHGHNDFYMGVANATCAWLYGAASVNCSLLGIGERTGNVPLEAMVMQYASLRGTLDGMDPTVITEIAHYYEKELGYDIPKMTPFIGENFNQTRAGIHADGLIKDEEIYNIFNTDKILNRPIAVVITSTSGLAGIALWLNQHKTLTGGETATKHDAVVLYMKDKIDALYNEGRTTAISDEEMEALYLAFKSNADVK
ncbi:MAG: 2-isopropylmalate synthase [Clostridia bacterium]|nr:2-isopropylmalate synthase [Clostridia bacterium]